MALESRVKAINKDVLKFSKVIDFEILCSAICFSYIYLIINKKDHLSIKKVVKNIRN